VDGHDLPFSLHAKCMKFNQLSAIPRTIHGLGMTSKSDPTDKPPGDQNKPADPLAGQPIEVLIDAIGRFAGGMQGLQGEDLKRFLLGLAVQMQSTVSKVEEKLSGETTRKEAAAEVDQLVDLLVRTGTTAGKAIEKHRGPITDAFKQADLQQLAAGMRALSEWMSNPTAHNEAEAKALMEQLESKLGPMVGHDPKLADARRKQQIRDEAQKSVESVRANLKTPDLKVKPPKK
jgi:hypothetical protein